MRSIIKCRVENLNKFRNEEGDCPTLVCTDLAARGLDLDVDHVIMFDFPSNSVCCAACMFFVFAFTPMNVFFMQSLWWFLCFQIDYLHRTGRTARMGAKGINNSQPMVHIVLYFIMILLQTRNQTPSLELRLPSVHLSVFIAERPCCSFSNRNTIVN